MSDLQTAHSQSPASDEVETRRYNLFVNLMTWTILFCVATSLINSIWFLRDFWRTFLQNAAILIAALVGYACLRLARHGQLRQAASLFLASAMTLVALATYAAPEPFVLNGAIGMIVLALLASLLEPPHLAVLWASAGALLYAIAICLRPLSPFRDLTYSPLDLVTLSGLPMLGILVTGLLARNLASSLGSALAHSDSAKLSLERGQQALRQAHDALQEANDQLRVELAEARHREESLRASARWAQCLVESAQDVVFVLDPTNGRYRLLHVPDGYGPAPGAVGRLPEQVLPRETASLLVKNVRRVAESDAPCTYDTDFEWDGQHLSFETTLSPVHDEHGNLAAVMGISRDIKRQKQAHAELAQAQKLAAMGRLLASMAHEVNNPLQALRSSLNLLTDHRPSEEKRRIYLQLASTELERVIAIVQRVLGFSRPARKGPEPLDVHVVLEETLLLVRSQLGRGGVTLHCDLCPGPLRVCGQPDELSQVFLNICLNAMQAMPEGGELNITTERNGSGDSVIIRFADCGEGIPQDELDQVFEPFHSTRPEGTGLGLAISYDIIKKHGGRIDVQSELGRGSTFSILLPARRAETQARPLQLWEDPLDDR